MLQIRKIRVEDRIEKCIPAAFPAWRIRVEGNLQGFHLIGIERTMKSRKRLGFNALNRDTEFGVAELTEDDTENTVRLKPSKRIGFADQSSKRSNDALQSRRFITRLWSLALYQHQHKTLPRALGPFALLAQQSAKRAFRQRLCDAAGNLTCSAKF